MIALVQELPGVLQFEEFHPLLEYMLASVHTATEHALNKMENKEEIIKSSKNQKAHSKEDDSTKSPSKRKDKPHKGNPAYQ